MPSEIKWLDEPEYHDYPAAESYLSLLFDEVEVKRLIKRLKKGGILWYHAKDIFRAADILHPLGKENFHVYHNLEKIIAKKALSPLLLVRNRPLIIADGFHRLCAVHAYAEDEMIPCKKAW